MKIKISYFYMIRYFKPYQIPISTALYPPKWFTPHIDKNGVINGLIISDFQPDPHSNYCSNCTKDKYTYCEFLRDYREKLNRLNIEYVLNELAVTATKVKNYLKFNEDPEIIFIVFEAPNNPCSERLPIIEYFRNYGIEVNEFIKDITND